MKTFRFVCLLTLLTANSARTCDVCGCYTLNQELNSESLHPREGGFYLASAEQYTFFGTAKLRGREVPNATDQDEQSSITQVIGGYRFSDRLGVRINAPLINCEYKPSSPASNFPPAARGASRRSSTKRRSRGATPSGIHGHDLALGSGSYDAVLGAGVFTRHKAGFFRASAQYTVRTTGAYDYRYANGVSFDAEPGYFFRQGHEF